MYAQVHRVGKWWFALQSSWGEVIEVGAERATLSGPEADGKAENIGGFNSGPGLSLIIIFYCCTSPSPGVLGCSQKNRVRNVLSSLHFHCVHLCQQGTERSVVKENTHLQDKNLALCKVSETGKRLRMRTS